MTLAQHPGCNPTCRACHYRDLEYPEQLARKQAWAERQLGEWKPVLGSIMPAPENERLAYRSKSWMRAQVDSDGVSFGFYRAIHETQGGAQGARWGEQFVSWDTCPIHTREIQTVVGHLREALRDSEWARRSLLGVWLGAPDGVVVAQGDREEGRATLLALPWKSILVPPFTRAWFHPTSQVGKKVFQHREFHPLTGQAALRSVPMMAFRQVAHSLLIQARELAVQFMVQTGPAAIVDLYCGTGELAHSLPASIGWIGVESSLDAVNVAEGARAGASLHRAFVGRVAQRLRDSKFMESIPAHSSLYLNPPRPGLGADGHEAITFLLERHPTDRIAYMSCSTSSLARDLRYFEAQGYRPVRLQPYDFFPQTEHFETLALLKPRVTE